MGSGSGSGSADSSADSSSGGGSARDDSDRSGRGGAHVIDVAYHFARSSYYVTQPTHKKLATVLRFPFGRRIPPLVATSPPQDGSSDGGGRVDGADAHRWRAREDESEWLFVDERGQDRFTHKGDTIVPGAGVRWKHVHRGRSAKPRARTRTSGAPQSSICQIAAALPAVGFHESEGDRRRSGCGVECCCAAARWSRW